MVANILGLGNASTPLGLKAMEKWMKEIKVDKEGILIDEKSVKTDDNK